MRAEDRGKKKRDLATEAFESGVAALRGNPALAALDFDTCRREDCAQAPDDGLVRADSNGTLHAHPTRIADPATWAWSLAHAALHLGFGHLAASRGERPQPDRYALAARCTVVNRFLLTFPVGRAPDELPLSYPAGDEEQLAARWRRTGLPAAYEHCGTAGAAADQVLVPWALFGRQMPDWPLAFATALTRTVSAAMDMAGGRRDSLGGAVTPGAPGNAR